MLQISVVTEGETFFTTALGVEFDEVAGYILDMLLGAFLHALPLARASRIIAHTGKSKKSGMRRTFLANC